ncbi:stefin-C-like [Plectropomus leopardus]|uniref:stefin-C-like n=1 Tax=Plectropomus leopardus TaxID=160734 RepID=UPI001C4DD6E0|nr:stefin-C-like [Plectropomus leopardus]
MNSLETHTGRQLASQLTLTDRETMAEVPVQLIQNQEELMGWGEIRDAHEETQETCDKVKSEVVKQTGLDFAEFKAVKYRHQCMCGAENLVIKIKVGEAEYIHLNVRHVTGVLGADKIPPSVKGIKQNKTMDDLLEIFH